MNSNGPHGPCLSCLRPITVWPCPDGNLPFHLPLDTCQALIGWETNRQAMELYNPVPGHRFPPPPVFHFSLLPQSCSVLSALACALAFRHRSVTVLAASRSLSHFLIFDLLFATTDPMAPRKPTKARAMGEDPGSLGVGWSCYLGMSLVKESDLAELILTGTLVEGQATYGGEAVVSSASDRRTVVFAAFFTAGLRLPCDDFLPSVLEMYEVMLPQLSPSVFPKLAVFTWMC